jgi:hypothetical protein
MLERFMVVIFGLALYFVPICVIPDAGGKVMWAIFSWMLIMPICIFIYNGRKPNGARD